MPMQPANTLDGNVNDVKEEKQTSQENGIFS